MCYVTVLLCMPVNRMSHSSDHLDRLTSVSAFTYPVFSSYIQIQVTGSGPLCVQKKYFRQVSDQGCLSHLHLLLIPYLGGQCRWRMFIPLMIILRLCILLFRSSKCCKGDLILSHTFFPYCYTWARWCAPLWKLGSHCSLCPLILRWVIRIQVDLPILYHLFNLHRKKIGSSAQNPGQSNYSVCQNLIYQDHALRKTNDSTAILKVRPEEYY